MPLMVTRPVIDRIASVTRVRWRSVVASRHWLRQAKTIIMSGMGGFSSCELGLGCPYSTRSSTALPHTHFGEGIDEKEEHWFAFLPSSRPPEGDTKAAQQRRETSLGPDQLPSTD